MSACWSHSQMLSVSFQMGKKTLKIPSAVTVLQASPSEEDAEEAIVSYLAKQNWKCQIYKAAHHGSKYSNTAELLAYLNPPITVISCGARNRYGHPHKETLERLGQVGSNVINTKETGAVSVQVVQGKIKISYSLPCR